MSKARQRTESMHSQAKLDASKCIRANYKDSVLQHAYQSAWYHAKKKCYFLTIKLQPK